MVFIHEYIILDIPDGIAIKGPPFVVEGDYITLECGVSKYYYHQDIKWTYQPLNQEEIPIPIQDSE